MKHTTEKIVNMTYGVQYPQYFDAIRRAIDEWDNHFENHDINDYLYEEDESVVYGIVEKLYTRIRPFTAQIPKEIKMKLPTLRRMTSDMMTEDSDLHLSDYEYWILDILKKTYKFNTQTIPHA